MSRGTFKYGLFYGLLSWAIIIGAVALLIRVIP